MQSIKLNLGVAKSGDRRLESLEQDIGRLKEVWEELERLYVPLNQIRDIQILNMDPKKVKKQLDDIVEALNSFPTRMR